MSATKCERMASGIPRRGFVNLAAMLAPIRACAVAVINICPETTKNQFSLVHGHINIV